MDSYILRIYQRPEDDSRRLVGVLETPDGNTRYVFRNAEELWRILELEATLEDEALNDAPRPSDD